MTVAEIKESTRVEGGVIGALQQSTGRNSTYHKNMRGRNHAVHQFHGMRQYSGNWTTFQVEPWWKAQRVPAFAELAFLLFVHNFTLRRTCRSRFFIIFSSNHYHISPLSLYRSSYTRFSCDAAADWTPARRTWTSRPI